MDTVFVLTEPESALTTILTTASDLVTAFAAIAVVFIAYKGLSAWRDKING